MRIRRGFTLVELLIVMVISALVGTALVRLFVSQGRFFDKQTTSRESRSVARGALNIMLSDLRMVDPAGVTVVTPTSLTIRVPYVFGIVCDVAGALTVSRLPMDATLYPPSAMTGYAWRDAAGAYNYVPKTADPAPGNAALCAAQGITMVNNGAVEMLAPTSAAAPVGTPMLYYQEINYTFAPSAVIAPRMALWRTVLGQAPEELVAPFADSARFRFYTGANDVPSDVAPAVPSDLRGIELDLPGTSERVALGTTTHQETQLTTSVFFKNRMN
jgi:prepilin-type N-terminal cleavage/methylation domain-containing protein